MKDLCQRVCVLVLALTPFPIYANDCVDEHKSINKRLQSQLLDLNSCMIKALENLPDKTLIADVDEVIKSFTLEERNQAYVSVENSVREDLVSLPDDPALKKAYEMVLKNIVWTKNSSGTAIPKPTEFGTKNGKTTFDGKWSKVQSRKAEYWKVDNSGFIRLCDSPECASSHNGPKNYQLNTPGLINNATCSNNAPASTDECKALTNSTIRLGAYMTRMLQISQKLLEPDRDEIAELYKGNYETWKRYTDGQPIMWEWEALANNWLRDHLYCEGIRYQSDQWAECNPKDENGLPVGRTPVPNIRYFFLHPEAVVTWKPTEADGDHSAVGLSLEWFGAMRTVFDGDEFDKPIGLSIVSIASDNVDVNEVGHGLLFRWGNFAFAGTWHDSDEESEDFVFSVTLNLSTLLFEKKVSDHIDRVQNAF